MATPSRRDTVWPGSLGGISLGKRNAPSDDESSSRLSASQIPQVPKGLPTKRRARPPGIGFGLKVNPSSQQFTHSTRSLRPDPSIGPELNPDPQQVPNSKTLPQIDPPSISVQGDPWKRYFRILTEDNNGPVTIAYQQVDDFPIVAIRRHVCKDEESIKHIIRSSHENIVKLQECFVGTDCLYFVYENIEISLAEIQATPYGALEAYHIAVVCQKVVLGIQYIHHELKILHGSIDACSVMVDTTGCVKIASIGQSMLSNVPSSGNERQDCRALGLLMVRLMELGTSLQHPDMVELQHPETWNKNITSFLQKTTHCSVETLLKDDFMEIARHQGYCLKPLVLLTGRSIQRDWQYCTG